MSVNRRPNLGLLIGQQEREIGLESVLELGALSEQGSSSCRNVISGGLLRFLFILAILTFGYLSHGFGQLVSPRAQALFQALAKRFVKSLQHLGRDRVLGVADVVPVGRHPGQNDDLPFDLVRSIAIFTASTKPHAAFTASTTYFTVQNANEGPPAAFQLECVNVGEVLLKALKRDLRHFLRARRAKSAEPPDRALVAVSDGLELLDRFVETLGVVVQQHFEHVPLVPGDLKLVEHDLQIASGVVRPQQIGEPPGGHRLE